MERKIDANKFLNTAMRTLSRKKDCKINNTTIYVLSKNSRMRSNDLGNKSQGHIDGLVKYFGFQKITVDKF